MVSNRSKRLNIICSLVILFGIAVMPFGGAGDLRAAENETLQAAPINAEFLEFWENPPETFYGYIPPPVDLSHLDEIPVQRAAAAAALPSTFDWRNQGKVTPVKDQNPCGTCWIFGTTSVLESAVLMGENISYNFAEQSVALCVDRSWVYLYDDADEPCGLVPGHGGGTSLMASEAFIKKGAVLESCNSYNPSGLQCDGTCVCDNCTPVKVVNGYRYVTGNQSQTALIKQAIYDHGPVTVAFYYDAACDHYILPDPPYGWVYDCATCAGANHLVSIIGWDDSIPHHETPGTGAWLVKNSWGTGWGNNGYFWLAYNSSCMTEIAYLKYKDYDPNEKLYYWDEAGWVDQVGYSAPSAWMANIFTSTQNGSLTYVDFWTTSNNAQYQIQVYLDGNISDGLQNLATSQSGTCQECGYYSIPLTSPVSLTSGQAFTIAVKMATPGFNGPIPVEEVIPGVCEPPIQTGVSYCRYGDAGAWDDLGTYGWNACLRARVTSAPVPNNPPNTPSSPSPRNHATVVSTNADLSWTGGDPDAGDAVTYDVYFGTNSTPPLVFHNQSATTYDPGTLAYNTKYYWKIIAMDNHGASTAGPLWDFTTDNPPSTPSNPSPANHATVVSINADLSWTGGDPDVGDTVTYDVYFGTNSTPPLLSSNQSATTYDPGTLAYSTQYYWKIIATDNHGASTAGSLWDFTTKPEVVARIVGETRAVNCTILSGVNVTLYQGAVEIASTVSNGTGNYTLAVPELGDYNVTASKDGFRDKTRAISVTNSTTYTLDFVAAYGLIPNAPDLSYVLACINLWQSGALPCQLNMSVALAVINAWEIPI